MKSFKLVLRLLILIFTCVSVAQAQSDLSYQMKAESQRFDIEAQALKLGLNAYERVTGIKLEYPDEIVEEKKTNGIQGTNTPAQALEKILSGTGLSYTINAKGAVVLQKVEEEKVTERPAIELQKTVVTATKTAHSLGDVPIGITVITREELEAANIHNLAEALRMVPGLYQLGKGVKIHGLNIDHTSLLIDGQKQYKCPGRMPIFNRYPIEMIERIEIKKGASSVLSGSETSGGVIHVITKSAPEKPTFSASTGFGSHGKQVHHAGGGSKIDKFGYQIDYSHNKYHGIDPDDEFTYDDVWGSLEYEFTPELKTVLKTSFYNQDSPGWKQRKYSLNSITEWHPDEVSKLVVKGSWLRLILPERGLDLNIYEGETYYNRLIKDRHLATLGYQFHGDYSDNWGEDQYTHNVYFQDEIDLSPFTLLLGARGVDHTWWGSDIFPQAGVLYKLTENLKLRASAERGFKTAKGCKIFPGLKKKWGKWSRSDPDLKPETSWSYQTGVEYQIHKKVLTTLSLFRNDLEDMVGTIKTTETHKGKPVYLITNIGKVRTQGGEFEVIIQFTDNLSGRLGYYFLDTEDRETGKELIYDPEHMANFVLDYRVPGFGLGINLRGEYVGERYTDSNNTEKLNGYFLAHAKITKDITKNLEAFLEVENIFDKKYEEYDEMPGTEVFGGVNLRF